MTTVSTRTPGTLYTLLAAAGFASVSDHDAVGNANKLERRPDIAAAAAPCESTVSDTALAFVRSNEPSAF